MPLRLDAADPGFEAQFARLLGLKRETAADVNAEVAAILADVRARGDAAVLDYTERFDRVRLTAPELRVTAAEVDAAVAAVDARTQAALEHAARRIESYHRTQVPTDHSYTDDDGIELGWRFSPLDSVGMYVPGGKAAYPSSVLMNALPARVAGVARMAMAVPAPDGAISPAVLAAARIAGIDEIYRIGGAQAVAALAYGTATVAAVDKIVGPGNAYVAAAKRQVFGTVGIDMIAGPSEIVVVADSGNDAAWIAADLLSQAEHDETAQAVLITDDRGFGDEVAAAAETLLGTLARATTARESWETNGAIVVVADLAGAADLVNRMAPEHLELAVAAPDELAARIRNAGAIFLGRHTPEAIGDYVAGPSHVLPTARSARFASGLSVLDFVKRTSLMRCDAAALGAVGPTAATLADAEGLGAHALSVRIRLGEPGG